MKSTKKKKSKKVGLTVLKNEDSPYKLQVIGNKVLVEEEPMEPTVDVKSGLTQAVCDAISSGKIILAEESRFALTKCPYRGTVLSVGERCKKGVKVGDRIHFAQFGTQRFQFKDKQFLIMHEDDVHGFYDRR